ncbi:MAG: DUF2752 domain-containing protein [Defluviitaleaceae bacterium]|nr:DUF2752 domain-containing protein [Defluviitaleaceae bacterium]
MRYFIGAGAFCIYFIFVNMLFGYACPSMIFVGLPCPACGLTRAGLLFLSGNFAESLKLHPLFVPVVAFTACAMAVKHMKPEKAEMLKTFTIVFLLIFISVYIFRMVKLFPHHAPMVVNSNSVLHNIINLIEKRS